MVYKTCVLLVFLFLTLITEQYLDVVTTEEREVKEEEGGQVFIISNNSESPELRAMGKTASSYCKERAGGLRDTFTVLLYQVAFS